MMTSRFWLNQDFIDKFSEKGSGKDAVALAGYKRAVGNFVRIVTGENIPVKFSNGNQSYTDGKVVTISTSSDPKDFDSNVGLALHEGSHIKLTNFDTIRAMDDFMQKDDAFMIAYASKHGFVDRWTGTPDKIKYQLKDILNVVEDRRIDNFVYTTAPGYRGYYNALYDKYFNHKIIDKGLQSKEYRNEDWDSYMFRLINITNPNRDLKALKGLQQIWDILDLANIDRLKSTTDSLQVAWDIFKVIEDNVKAPSFDQEDEQGKGKASAGKSEGGMKTPGDDPADINDTGEKGEGEDSEDTGDDNYEGNGQGRTSENDEDEDAGEEEEGEGGDEYGDDEPDDNFDQLSPRELSQLQKAQQAQKDFLNQKIKKKKSNRALDRTVDALDAGDVDTKEVKYGDDGNLRKVNVTVVRNVTPRMIDDVSCSMWYRYGKGQKGTSGTAVKEGMILGQMLGKRLKVRAESRDTKFNRLRSGKIDKRMISSAGFGHEGIFQKLETFSYTPSIIHISIDNSGSMAGSKLHQAVKTATAIAKACSMIENMDCIISYRCDGHFAGGNERPLMVVAYDSRKHKLVQFNQVVQYIGCGGTTPEGLCFDAVMNEIIGDAKGKDAYFLNFSDGEPYSGSYEGKVAYEHTRRQVQKMLANGIKVISYFIGGSGHGNSANNFRTMYGKDASFIDVNSVVEVSKTMNKKFLETV